MKTRRQFHAGRIATGSCLLAVAAAMVVGCQPIDATDQPVDVGEDFLATGRTLSFFTALQVDPRSEDSAGPQFVVAEDLNADGLIDLVSAWNQSQPVQVHLQGRTASGDPSFETVTLAGNLPILLVSGLAVADFDNDGHPDIAVMAKHTALADPACLDSEVPDQATDALAGLIAIYLGPANPAQANQSLAWEEVQVGASFLAGAGEGFTQPDMGGFTSLVVDDINQDHNMDLAVAWNSDCGGATNAVVLFLNEGPTRVRDGTWTAFKILDNSPHGTVIRDIALGDIDGDSDLDIIATYPDAETMNVRWYRNPQRDDPDNFHISDGNWQVGTIGHIATQSDSIAKVNSLAATEDNLLGDIAGDGLMADGRVVDIDGDGILDVVVRSGEGGLIQWFKGPPGPTTAPLRNIPWQVYTLAEFTERKPEVIAMGDINLDGQVDVLASAEGGLAWFNATEAQTIYDQWTEHLIVDEGEPEQVDIEPATTDPNVAPEEIPGTTQMNSILVVDLDDDGASDIIMTLDRRGLSGLTNDALVWLRNTR